jgi:hypothetical protein
LLLQTGINIGFVTCAELGGITDDDRLTATILAQEGVTVKPVYWDRDEPSAQIGAFIVRSPWNYHLNHEAFLAWIDRASRIAPVFNDPVTIRWNAHKGYLFDVEAAGATIAPTVLCRKRQPSDLRAIMIERDWSRVIIKPAISSSSFMTAIVGTDANARHHTSEFKGRFISDGQEHLTHILETRDALVQPFIQEVFTRGERSLIFIDGEFSHCVHKDPFTDACGGGRAADADTQEIEVGRRALGVLRDPPLYARVDLLRDNGIDRVMEFELIDPELYFRFGAESPRRFADAMMRRLNQPHVVRPLSRADA